LPIAGNYVDDGCQLSLPARTYAVAIPVSSLLIFNIYALIRTAVALLKGQVRMLLSAIVGFL